jgi:hypothetical protein
VIARDSLALVLGSTLLGAATGLVLGGPLWTGALGAAGLLAGLVAARAGIRPLVALAVLAGTLGGALVGRGIVRALCLPGSCVGLEVTAAVATGIGALIGIGLVVALVTRSFDEYHEAIARRETPPEPGCETDEQP